MIRRSSIVCEIGEVPGAAVVDVRLVDKWVVTV